MSNLLLSVYKELTDAILDKMVSKKIKKTVSFGEKIDRFLNRFKK